MIPPNIVLRFYPLRCRITHLVLFLSMHGKKHIPLPFFHPIQYWVVALLVTSLSYSSKGQGVPYSDFYNMLYPAQAVACGLTINDSIDERRHPLMMARAIQHWKLTGCVEPVGFDEKKEILTHQIDSWEDSWQPVRIAGGFDFLSLTKVTGIEEKNWVDKNPQFTFRIVPIDSCWLFIPRDLEVEIDTVIARAKMLYQTQNTEKKAPKDFYTVIVRSGESLSIIARREGVSIDEIQAWNGLYNFTIYPGQELIIGAYPQPNSPTNTTSDNRNSLDAKSDVEDGPVYIVREGDSLWSIARQYPGVSAQNIIDHNRLNSEKIDVGQKLIIPKYE